MRGEPAPRIAEDRPLDEVAVSYVFDDLVLSPGSQRALFGARRRARRSCGGAIAGSRSRRAEQRRVNAGPALGGERDAVVVSPAAT